MKLTLYMAISVDGFITKGENDSDWVSDTDWEQFHSYIKQSDAVIMGRKTMDQFGDDFPIEGITNFVLSKNEKLHRDTQNLVITKTAPLELIDLIKKRNLMNILLIGGANTNQQFLEAGLIDEIVLSVHPLVIGRGLKLFGEFANQVNLQLVSNATFKNELVQIVYKVIK